jgi:hypothetical protein
MKKLAALSMLVLLGMTPLAVAQQAATFEDAVRLASDGMIIRGTVLDSSTEGKDVPVPNAEPGTTPLLHTTWRVRIDECYYSAGADCPATSGSTISVAAVTGVAIEREGTRAYGELITNSATLAVTVPLGQGGSVLLFLRPSPSKTRSYQIVPLRDGSQALNSDRIEVGLRRYDLLSDKARAEQSTQDLRRRRNLNPSAPAYHDEVALKDLADLIRRVRGNAPDAPQLDPQAPQR